MALTITIDERYRAFVEEQALLGMYRSVDKYIEALIESDRQELEDQEREREMLIAIAKQKGDITDEDRMRVCAEIRRPRIEKIREMLRPALECAERGEFVEFDAEDIMRRGREILAERRAKSEGGPTGERA